MPSSPRDISYVHGVKPGVARVLIRSVENLTGRRRLMRLSRDYERDRASGYDFWELALRYSGLQLRFSAGAPDNIPAEGPLICIANHPFGILDGLIMGYLLSLRRGKDFKVLAHSVFKRTEDLGPYILPVSFDETPETYRKNLSVRREALDYLDVGGAVGIFPSGQVATAARPFGPVMDRAWQSYTARLILRSNAVVVPIYFSGQNSRLFQLVGRANDTVRLAFLLREFVKRVNGVVDLAIGAPLHPDELEKHSMDPRILMDYLRCHTYSLAASPVADLGYGWDWAQSRGKLLTNTHVKLDS